jgi:N,N'-diacetyllegionaminate synthase
MRKRETIIGDKTIGAGYPIFVIAEVGVNHDGRIAQARRLIDEAADAGADAVKFQTFRADRLMTVTRERLSQQGGGGETAFEMFRRLELSYEAHRSLKEQADLRGITFLSTPFDEESVDFLDELGVPAFKIASADLTFLPLLKRIASKRKPVILSTGMSHVNEVADALGTLKSSGADDVVLLHCVSSYPAPPDSLNLRVIPRLASQFGLPVGYSDHSDGVLMPLVAASLGAVLIEKHFTLDRNGPGPDHRLSADPAQFTAMVAQLRDIEMALGDGRKCPKAVEEEGRRLGRRSIVSATDIRAYEPIAPWMLAFKRPGTGLAPREADKVVGMVARRDIPRDTVLQWDDIAPPVHAGEGNRQEAPVAREATPGPGKARRDSHA